MTDLFDLTGKVAVVTGGSRGMGREMVLAFAQHGADVVIASRKIDACEDLAEEVRDTTGQRALAVACHVGYWDQCDALGDTVYDEFGRCGFDHSCCVELHARGSRTRPWNLLDNAPLNA